jgi:1-phosphofructokinase
VAEATAPTRGVAVFAPVTLLTITVERDAGGEEELHVHAGGQGVWQARMATTLDASAVLCTPLGGESGLVLGPLLAAEGIELAGVEMASANPSWVQDRRKGDRTMWWESPPFALGRHEVDELFSATLAQALTRGVCVVAGTHEGVGALDPEIYRRLVGDLRASDVEVVVDVTGEELDSALDGGPSLVKISDEDMRRDGLLDGDDERALARLAQRLHERGAARVVVSCAGAGAFASDGESMLSIGAPELEVADARGAGDSMTAALAVGLARGADWPDVLRLGAAAGAVNVTRHGSGSGRRDTVDALADRVEVQEVPG